jgi:hypothetical protein
MDIFAVIQALREQLSRVDRVIAALEELHDNDHALNGESVTATPKAAFRHKRKRSDDEARRKDQREGPDGSSCVKLTVPPHLFAITLKPESPTISPSTTRLALLPG